MAVLTVAVLLALVACIAALAVRAMRDRDSYSTIPGPPSLPILGHALEFINLNMDSLFPTIVKLIGDRPLCLIRMFHCSVVVATDPDHISELVRRKEFNDKSVFAYSLLHVVAKRGLIQLSGPEWKEHRTWLAPGFKKSVLDTFISDFNAVGRDFVKSLPVDEDIRVNTLVGKPMARAFIITSLGEDWKRQEDIKMVTDFIDEFFRTVMSRTFNPFLWSDKLFNVTSEGRNLQRMKLVADSITKTFIDLKRDAMQNKSTEPVVETQRKTLMDIMIETPENKEPMSEEAIQDEVKTSFAASVETSATAMCWALKILSLRPDLQEKLLAELDQVFGDSDRDVSIEDFSKLKYMERFYKEVLRMYPPVPFIARQCHKDTELWGHKVRAGWTLAINIFGVHRDPRHWTDPNHFDPDRFLPEVAKDRHPYAYIPFSAGSRNCIGGTYAMQLLLTVTANTLRSFSVHPVNDGLKDIQSLTDNLTYNITSRLRGGVNVRFRSRTRTAGLSSHN